MEDPTDDPPEAANTQPGETEYTEVESSPTSVPEDIVVPLENQFGENQTAEQEEAQTTELEGEIVYKSIWPPIIFSFLTGLLLGGFAFFIPSQGVPHLAKQFQQNTQPTSPPERNQASTKPGNTRAIVDRGLNQGEPIPSSELAVERIRTAKNTIVWIANFPENPQILNALQQKKQENLSILVIVGRNTPTKFARTPVNLGLVTVQTEYTLEEPQSLLLIDNNYVIDISRNRTIWESIDPYVSETVGLWVADLIETSKPIQ